MTWDANNLDDDNERSFFQRFRIAIILGAIIVIGGVVMAGKWLSGQGHSQHKAPEMAIASIKLPPPPATPPPPPPPPPPPQEQKMIEQTPVNEPEQKPEAKSEPPPDLGTNIKGDGPSDGFGLGASTGNGKLGSQNSGRSASRWGWYAGQVQSRIADSLRNNRKTRAATISNLTIRIWPDTTGRVTRAQLVASTGDAALDIVIRNEVLNGLQLQEPPPAGMPMPIVLRMSARRPN